MTSARAEREEAPAPIAHAAPDVELAEAQLAVGRDPELESGNGALAEDEELELEAAGPEAEPVSVPRGRRRAGREAEPAAQGAEAAEEHRPSLISRLIAFLQGSWAELQRVQWPDRRQVMQATGVVIGFVIIAGLFLGLADLVASHLVKLILK